MATTTPTLCDQRDRALGVPDPDAAARAAAQLARAQPVTPGQWERMEQGRTHGRTLVWEDAPEDELEAAPQPQPTPALPWWRTTWSRVVAGFFLLTALLSVGRVLALPWGESLPEIGYAVRCALTGELL